MTLFVHIYSRTHCKFAYLLTKSQQHQVVLELHAQWSILRNIGTSENRQFKGFKIEKCHLMLNVYLIKFSEILDIRESVVFYNFFWDSIDYQTLNNNHTYSQHIRTTFGKKQILVYLPYNFQMEFSISDHCGSWRGRKKIPSSEKTFPWENAK